MSQHDFTIANQTASSARSDINSALQALATNNSGASAPSTTYTNMWWYDTGANLLKQRNEADTAWVNVAYVNQTTNKFEILDDTKVVTTSGTQVGILGDQSTATWETGTGTTESLVSPASVKAAIQKLAITDYDMNHDGYIELFMGFKLVWGRVLSSLDSAQAFTFHEAFTNNCWGVAAGGFSATVGGATGAVYSISTTGFTFDRSDSSVQGSPYLNYIAWGN